MVDDTDLTNEENDCDCGRDGEEEVGDVLQDCVGHVVVDVVV